MKICRKNRVVSLIHSFCHRRNVTAKLGSSHHSRRVSEGSLLFVLSFFKIFILQPELINDCLSPSMSKVKYVERLLVKVPTYRLSELSAISEESLRMTKPGVWAEEPSKQNRVAVPRSKDSGALCDSGIRRTVPMNGTFFFFFILK